FGQQGPQSGGFPQQGYGQPGPYGQQPGYGGFGGPPPKKSNTGMIIGVVIGVLVLVGGGITAAVLLSGNDSKSNSSSSGNSNNGGSDTSGGDDTADVKKAAEAYIAAAAAKNESKAKSLACKEMLDEAAELEKNATPEQKKLAEELKKMPAPKMTYKGATVSGDTATVKIEVSANYGGQNQTADSEWKFKKVSGDWKFCTLQKDIKVPTTR
ncbi:hypothetical protein C8D87_108274, partial [Lentzea atacamensis]